jgi:hypothetical protein
MCGSQHHLRSTRAQTFRYDRLSPFGGDIRKSYHGHRQLRTYRHLFQYRMHTQQLLTTMAKSLERAVTNQGRGLICLLPGEFPRVDTSEKDRMPTHRLFIEPKSPSFCNRLKSYVLEMRAKTNNMVWRNKPVTNSCTNKVSLGKIQHGYKSIYCSHLVPVLLKASNLPTHLGTTQWQSSLQSVAQLAALEAV